uniref:WWE domain-containing protein n=1 Tax=Arcella intermedia TaxID=1963864 RepID=A0A6B2LA52_9EUKA
MNALKTLQLDVNNPEQIIKNGVFGWHGTKTDQAVQLIAHHNLDPGRRSGQVYGPGEYCAKDYRTSFSYMGPTETLFLFFILKKCKPYSFNVHYVINNPVGGNEMYMIPVLIATLNKRVPININCAEVGTMKGGLSKWQWKDEKGWVDYGKGQNFEWNLQAVIEEAYQKYKSNRGTPLISFTFIRLKDKEKQRYTLDFQAMTQKNNQTNFVRTIRSL